VSRGPIQWRAGGPAVQPLEDGWLASPGWLDLQVNGYAGLDLNAPGLLPATVVALTGRLWREGVAAYYPTLITGTRQRYEEAISAIVAARDEDSRVAASIPGIHLEGPYISPLEGARGAHPLADVRPPDWAEFTALQDRARGLIRLVTLAPEAPGALPFIERLAAAGILVAIGHTLANGTQIRAAVDAGARLSTHLGNGAPAMLPRHPNVIWDQLGEDRLSASLIVDYHHLPPHVARAMIRAKGVERSCLISDSVAIAGLAPGQYDTAVGEKVELAADGRLSLAGTPYLAGSSISLREAVEKTIPLAGLEAAVRMASLNPATVAGVSLRSTTVFRVAGGSIEIGAVLHDGHPVHVATYAAALA
jgi:N-acetylglucosamine-6-phosphate deacetylase